MYISEIVEINNYRNLTGKTITFNDTLNFLIGENNIGKTNILELINICLAIGKFAETDFMDITLPIKIKFKVKEVKELIDCRLQEKNISLDVFCEPKELVKKFDQDLMISVVTNLIDNAVKASRKESKIVLEATPDHLMVQDFGKGIPKEDLEMVTEPFYMVDKSRSRAKGSVGLGLSLCQKIIELHDFQLKIESNPGKGTTVSVFW